MVVVIAGLEPETRLSRKKHITRSAFSTDLSLTEKLDTHKKRRTSLFFDSYFKLLLTPLFTRLVVDAL